MKKAKKVKKAKPAVKAKKKVIGKKKAKVKPANKKAPKKAKPASAKAKAGKPAKKKIVAKKAARAKPSITKAKRGKTVAGKVSKPAAKAGKQAFVKPEKKRRRSRETKAEMKRRVEMTLTPAPKPAPPVVRKEDEVKQLYLAQKPSVPLRIPVKSVLPLAKKSRAKEEPNKSRYTDKELEEFRQIILVKIDEANKELSTLQQQMTTANEHGTDDTASTFKVLEDGSDTLAKEEAGQLAARQKKFIEQLENALIRIENKTYGICRVTGKLIPKERLRAVPHTTQSIEAKLSQYRD
ncbi:MAG TPA: TraR/DksA C4-type zinc finger protein [Bacteroidia bacterium]|nr:TraR/DksA C4-type zinc finger protein [Bacteroidia bacterium]